MTTCYRTLTPLTNGLAIAGDCISAATVLSAFGVVALNGYDGLVLMLSTVPSLLLMMSWWAERPRKAGRFTLGDVLARRMPGRRVRSAACAVTLAAVLLFLLVPLSVAGSLVTFVPGINEDGAKPDFHWFPLQTTGIVSAPIGFLAGRLGSRTSRRPAADSAAGREEPRRTQPVPQRLAGLISLAPSVSDETSHYRVTLRQFQTAASAGSVGSFREPGPGWAWARGAPARTDRFTPFASAEWCDSWCRRIGAASLWLRTPSKSRTCCPPWTSGRRRRSTGP